MGSCIIISEFVVVAVKMRNFAAKQKTDKEVSKRFQRCLFSISGVVFFTALPIGLVFVSRNFRSRGYPLLATETITLADCCLGGQFVFLVDTFEKIVQIKFSGFKSRKSSSQAGSVYKAERGGKSRKSIPGPAVLVSTEAKSDY
jgi:hypothetical protein